MSKLQQIIKRIFDIFGAFTGLLFLTPIACVLIIFLKLTSKGPVFFRQQRIGQFGRSFQCIKFRTMAIGSEVKGTITTATDSRVTPIGKFLRRYKLDELPQLWNVLIGRMSFVGPRPDVPGYADLIEGEDRRILILKPGITGPASVFFRYEEELLVVTPNPEAFNNEIIWPFKVRINLHYLETWRFWKDIGYIVITILPFFNNLLKLLPPSPLDPKEFKKCVEEWNIN